MSLERMENDYLKRGYLLPEGCKDLIDALQLKARLSSQFPPRLVNPSKFELKQWMTEFLLLKSALKPQIAMLKAEQFIKGLSSPLPPVIGEIVVSSQTTVLQLAALLGQKALRIIADVMALGFFVGEKDLLSFEIVSGVARKHGFVVKRAAG